MVFSLLVVGTSAFFAWYVSSLGYTFFLGVVLPLLSFSIFLLGLFIKIFRWAYTPILFAIPTTSGQQKSLSGIRHARFDSPYTVLQTIIRIFLEIFFFRSLLKDCKTVKGFSGQGYRPTFFLWTFSLLFHITLFITLLRHSRFFIDPAPSISNFFYLADSFLNVGIPNFLITNVLLSIAIIVLLARRTIDNKVHYISFTSDYFPLFLFIGIIFSGIWMRYIDHVDVLAVKELSMNLVSLHLFIPKTLPPIFFAHLFLVCLLLIYFPWSKLTHAGGIFFSPTRNMPNNTRAIRYNNPLNKKLSFRTYEEYEQEFHEALVKMKTPIEDKKME